MVNNFAERKKRDGDKRVNVGGQIVNSYSRKLIFHLIIIFILSSFSSDSEVSEGTGQDSYR